MARNQDETTDNEDHMGLSEAELAAIESDIDDVDTLKEIAGEDDEDVAAIDDTDEDEDDEDLDDDEDVAAIAAAKADSVADAAGDTTDTADDESDLDDDEPEFQSSYKAEPVENFDAQIQDIADQKKALRVQLTNGDIDMDAYEDAKDALVAKEQGLREQNLKATIAAEQSEQNAQARWTWEQERFFADKTNSIYNDKYLMGMLDMAIKDLAQTPANAQRSAPWFLQEADKLVRERTGNQRDVTATPKIDPKKETESKRKPDLSKVPKSLAGLPAAELPDTGEEEFAHLEKLDGLKLEAAIAKLSPSQLNRYLGTGEE